LTLRNTVRKQYLLNSQASKGTTTLNQHKGLTCFPIAKEYRPEDRNVEYGKEGHDKCNAKGFRDGIPERRLIS
jgi:hypothetical protein